MKQKTSGIKQGSIYLDDRVKKCEIDLSNGEWLLLTVKHSKFSGNFIAELAIDVSESSLVISEGKLKIENVMITPL